jgi:hypothetical protein
MRKVILLLTLIGLAYVAYHPIKDAITRAQGGVGMVDGVLSCEFNGQTFKLGEQRHASDACNVCACGQSGWSCTKISCPADTTDLGTVSGSIGYPDGKIPSERVCASSLTDDREFCQVTIAGDKTYAILAPPGDYWIYAATTGDGDVRRAYYSAFESCGGKPQCKDHSPITVKLESGKISQADPKDWSATAEILSIAATPSKWQWNNTNYYPNSVFEVKSRKLSKISLLGTPLGSAPDAEAKAIGDAGLLGEQEGVQIWNLPIPAGFKAGRVYAVGTALNGDITTSRDVRYVVPTKDPGATAN